jgi:drug/metabolite transporter (DMT)-like permease
LAGTINGGRREYPVMSDFLDRYVKTAGSPPLQPIRDALWNDPAAQPGLGSAEAASVILEQYKIYVEMADRVSARRGSTNTFFLTLNTTAVTAIGLLWSGHLRESKWILAFLFVGLIIQCMAWFGLLRSYRQLNSAKYAVVGVLEERLPASPYWSAEWMALGAGNDPARYLPLSHLEQWIPSLFAIVYIFGFILGMTVQ